MSHPATRSNESGALAKRRGGAGIQRHMDAYPMHRRTWREALAAETPLLLPAAHDALAARIIERAGFTAYQVGGYALSASRYAHPDIDLEQFGEKRIAVSEIIGASELPVMVDADDGYGDAKNVTRVVQTYEAMGVGAIFIEDQKAPKRCGHMAGKEVIPADHMVEKIRAAIAARRTKDFFIMARTDSRANLGLDEALRRGEMYLKTGADALFIEAPKSVEELERIGKTYQGAQLAANMLEGGGETPILPPSDLHRMGFTMVLYPTSLMLRITLTMQRALAEMKRQRLHLKGEGVSFDDFENLLDLPEWAKIEEQFPARQ